MYIEGNNNENKNGCGGGLQYDVPCCLGIGACVLNSERFGAKILME